MGAIGFRVRDLGCGIKVLDLEFGFRARVRGSIRIPGLGLGVKG